MAFLVVNGTTVPVALGQASRTKVEVGDRARAWSGQLRSTVRARKREWTVTTKPMARALADALETAAEGGPPVTCSGDLLGGSVSCHVRVSGWEAIRTALGERAVLRLEILEA